MAASFLASYLIFVLTGIYSLYRGLGFTQDETVKWCVFGALLLNATFYHYVSAYTEMDSSVRDKLKKATRFEWFLRVANQCFLLSLWFWLDHGGTTTGWRDFGRALMCLYGTFLLWDAVTWRCFSTQGATFWANLRAHKLFWVDVAGAVLSWLYVQAGYVVLGQVAVDGTNKNNVYFLIGGLSLAYLALPAIGLSILRFNPFKAEYRKRPELR